MRIRFAHILAAMVTMLAGARAAVAQDSDAAVTAALLRFVDALEAGDAQALEELICADTTYHERTRKTFIDLATAQKALEKSAVAKFGDEGKKFRCGFDLIVNAGDRKTITNAQVRYLEGTRMARVERAGEMTPMELRRNSRNQWQVILNHIDEETEDSAEVYSPFPYQPGEIRRVQMANIRNKKYSAITSAFRETAARIDDGTLTSAAAAQAELIAKLTAASAEAARARAAIPSGRRDRQQPQPQQQ
jgi:hypothetical protein